MKKLSTILILLVFNQMLFGQNDLNTGIIYGDKFAFSLTAPKGWILDNKSGVTQGLYAVFYRQGESWDKALTVMYANTASLEDKAHKTLDQLIKYDLDNFRSNYSDIKIIDGNNIVIKDKIIAKVKYLSGKSYGNYEAMAYIDAGKTGIMIIMSSRSENGYKNSLTAFEDLVKSYFFMADKVVIDKKNK
jgi:hypothetical protein